MASSLLTETFKPVEVPAELGARIELLSWEAYAAVRGHGYGRVDLRMDAASGELHVLEVNAQCGLSEDENYTSIGAILRVSKRSSPRPRPGWTPRIE